MPPAELIPADEAHAARLGDLHVACWREAYEGLMPAEYLSNLDATKRSNVWLKIIKGLGSRDGLYLAKVDDAFVGFISFGAWRGAELVNAGEIFAIYLLKAWQGTGIGKLMLDASLKQMSQHGFNNVGLWVLDSNSTAIKFYKRQGGSEAGVSHSISIGGTELVEVLVTFSSAVAPIPAKDHRG